MHEQTDTEAEGEKQLVLLKQGAAHVDIQRVGKVVPQDLQSEAGTCVTVLISTIIPAETKPSGAANPTSCIKITSDVFLKEIYYEKIPVFLLPFGSLLLLRT